MFRSLSLGIRFLQSHKNARLLLKTFIKWQVDLKNLPPYKNKEKKLLIIRLDDIGDYLLFRNSLEAYKSSSRWKDYDITLLGNIIWKDLFEELDSSTVDKTIWIDKTLYLKVKSSRKSLCERLREEGFEYVICPSRTRPLLVDDLCVIATGALKKIGIKNTSIHTNWNKISDDLYTELYFDNAGIMMHEFYYNQEFTNWCCGTHLAHYHPYINNVSVNSLKDKYIVCFIGSSTPSKRWPAENWIQLIRLCNQTSMPPIIIIGGKADIEMANFIQKETNTPNTAGKTSLIKTLYQVANAAVVITNDTMAAHAAASFSKPTIIIANGNNHYQFTDYNQPDMYTIYPDIFLSKLQKKNNILLNYTAVTKDIASIEAMTVFNKLKTIIAKKQNDPFLATIIPENVKTT